MYLLMDCLGAFTAMLLLALLLLAWEQRRGEAMAELRKKFPNEISN